MDNKTGRPLGRRQFLFGLLTAGASLLAGNLIGKSPLPSSASGSAAPAGGPIPVVNVKDFGAKGDGKKDDSAAFAAAMTKIWTQHGTTVTGNRRPMFKLFVPPGTYLIRSPQALMSAKMANPSSFIGLIVEGSGRFVTQILFQPEAKDAYLLYNNNCFLHMTFRDIGFVAKSANAHFMYSLSTGNAQNYRFDNVNWTGTWGHGLVLEGSNTNSEMAWYHCGISGSWKAFLHVPQSVGKSGDQFVNYNFYDTNFEVEQGNFIHMQYGGSVNIWGGSIMYYGDTAGTFFVFGNSIHNGGAMRFLCQGVRFELPNANAKLIDCSWAAGSVTFIGCDNASQQHLGTAMTGGVNSIFRLGNESGPSVTWIGCVLQGKHEYRYAGHAFDHSANITYYNCEISQYRTANEFVVTTGEDREAEKAAAPAVRFIQCRGKPGSAQAEYLFDGSVNWMDSYRAVAANRYIRIATADNRLPKSGGQEGVFLPLGAIIVSIRMYMPPHPGRFGSSWRFSLRTSEPFPTVLATAAPEGGDPNRGMNVLSPQFFVCDSDAKRHVVLYSADTVSEHAAGFCLIEYIG